ncbi:hypothetical protein PTSG_12166 [Salpingoeca rosetta]|uniref:Fungal lipase-like domain-containing protein n=1 Tax=Salpingoeca rosetta (strain ATCC 50818 / BSB-021) TaxID=946362 RepID=F2U8F3_SALR5|nr:uncharacterized protein PTSG_12166 [Salpingoeca rosetta]EGD72661.1 hypothetical protein PTSG_12166 [Salpingoeca rosetta]|eukprot:XP_004994484.1 hypothetical protein PTSG_12166 [Salpingoeca rosetta]
MESMQHLYSGKFVYPLSDFPSDVQDCLQHPDKYNIPEVSPLRTCVKLSPNEAGHGMEVELLEKVSLDDIKDEFFATVRIPQICKENDIDPNLAMNFAADVERENAESITEHRYKNFLYFGQVNIHEQPHGFGMAFFDDGSRYIGVWLRGSYYGYGIFISGDPALPFEYRGQFLGGRINGCGMLRLKRTNREITDRLTQRELDSAYVGEFDNGKFLRMVNAVQKGLLAERQATKRAAHIISSCEKARGLRNRDASKSYRARGALAVGGYQKDWLATHFSFRSRALPFLTSRSGEGALTLQRNNILPLLQRAACACHLAEVHPDERRALLTDVYQGYFSHPEVQPTQSGSDGHSQLVFIHESFQTGARRRFIVFSPLVTEELNNEPRSAYFQNLLSLVPMDYIQHWLRRGTQVIVAGHSIGGMLAVMLCAQVMGAPNLDLEMLRKSLFCITLGAPLLPDTYMLAGQLQRHAQDVWKEWCKTNRHFVLIKEDPVPALGVFLRKKEWPKTYLSLRDAGMLSSRDQCRASVSLGGLQLGTNVLNVLKKEAIDGIPWILENKFAKNVGWKQVFTFVKDVAEMKLLDIQANCTNHAINIYVSQIIIALESLKTKRRQDAPQALALEESGETDVDADLDMNTDITDVWVEVSENGTTHFCLGGRELRLLSDVHVLPFSDTTSLQLGTMDDLPEGSVLIWSRDDRQSQGEAQWEQVSVTDTQVDFTVKLNRSRVLTLLNLSEALVTPRHIKGSIGRGMPRSKVAGLTLYARSLLAGQVIPVSMENITLPTSSSHMRSYLSSHSSSRDLASMAYLKAVLLRQAAMRLAQKQGVSQEDFAKVLAGNTDAVEHEDKKAIDCMASFLTASEEMCGELDQACCFLDLSALLLAWHRINREDAEVDDRTKSVMRNTLRAIILSYFNLGSYASEEQAGGLGAYRYKLPSKSLPEDLLQPLGDLLSDVDQVNLPSKTCQWDGFLPDYSSLISDMPPKFRDAISNLSFTSALHSQSDNLEQALDPSSLQQTQLLLRAESAIELFHIFFDGDFPFHSRRTVDRFWASLTSLPSSIVFSVASAVVRPFVVDDNPQRKNLNHKTAYLRRHRQYQQATITGFNMKLALLARLLPKGSSDFSCLSVIEEAIINTFVKIDSVQALRTRLQRHEQADSQGLDPRLQEFMKNMAAMGVSSQDNPHAFETICRWIYSVVKVRQPLFERLLEQPIIGVYGAQGAGKSLMLNQLGFDTKSAFGDGNTKAFDVHPVGSTGVLIADSFGFNEAVGDDSATDASCSEEFLRAKDAFGTAFLGQLRYVIYVSSSSSQRGYNKEEDESLLKLRNVPCHVLYLITKFDSFLKRFDDDDTEVAHQEAKRILAERREQNARALPGKSVETRFYSNITPRGYEQAMDDAYEKLGGDFWRPADLKAHMRKVLVLNCDVDPVDAAEALALEIDKEQDAIAMPPATMPLYS